MTRPCESPRAALEVICVTLGLDGEPSRSLPLHALLVRGEAWPADSSWALPGGRVDADESLEEAVWRYLGQSGVSVRSAAQLCALSAPRNDGERIVSIAYCALAHLTDHRAAVDAIAWFPVEGLPALPPRHHDLVSRAVTRMREDLRRTPIGFGLSAAPPSSADVFDLLPPRFSLTQLQRLCETIEGTSFDKRNFRKKVLATGLLVDTDEVEQGVSHRAAKLYRFDRRRYERLVRQLAAEPS